MFAEAVDINQLVPLGEKRSSWLRGSFNLSTSDQVFCAISGSMGMVSVGIFNATSGCILPQLETDPDMKITEDEGSWFGKMETNDLNRHW